MRYSIGEAFLQAQRSDCIRPEEKTAASFTR